MVEKNIITRIIEDVTKQHPYRKAGHGDSYSPYKEGWSDACDTIISKLEEFVSKQIDIDSEFVDIVNDNFWNLIDDPNKYDPCKGCPNNKPGEFQVCNCTLPYINRITCTNG